jgi:hypothetical protein
MTKTHGDAALLSGPNFETLSAPVPNEAAVGAPAIEPFRLRVHFLQSSLHSTY